MAQVTLVGKLTQLQLDLLSGHLASLSADIATEDGKPLSPVVPQRRRFRVTYSPPTNLPDVMPQAVLDACKDAGLLLPAHGAEDSEPTVDWPGR
jgi:hypothetical protein